MTDDFSLVPGAFVLHPEQAEWGVGQIQSVACDRITVNFEHPGKIVINARVISLKLAGPDPRG